MTKTYDKYEAAIDFASVHGFPRMQGRSGFLQIVADAASVGFLSGVQLIALLRRTDAGGVGHGVLVLYDVQMSLRSNAGRYVAP